MGRERHNINFEPEIWKILNNLKQVQNKSISEIISDSVRLMLTNEGYNESYFRLMSSDFCDDAENEELTKLLDSLSTDDLKVADSRTLSL